MSVIGIFLTFFLSCCMVFLALLPFYRERIQGSPSQDLNNHHASSRHAPRSSHNLLNSGWGILIWMAGISALITLLVYWSWEIGILDALTDTMNAWIYGNSPISLLPTKLVNTVETMAS